MKTNPKRRRRRNTRGMEGMTLIEIMVVTLIMAMMSAGIAVAVMNHLETARRDVAKTAVKTLRNATHLFLMQNPDECPTLERLIDDGMIEPNTDKEDPWKTPYFIVCDEGAVVVFSAGKDKREGTEDDIR